MIDRLVREFDALERERMALHARLDALTPAQRAFRRAADAWTIPEIAHHLAVAERLVYGGATRDGVNRVGRKRRPREVLGNVVFFTALRCGLRVPMPNEKLAPRRGISPEEVRREWDDVRSTWRAFIESLTVAKLPEMAFRHPVTGPITYAGLLDFLGTHFAHHTRQERRVRAARGFPGERG